MAQTKVERRTRHVDPFAGIQTDPAAEEAYARAKVAGKSRAECVAAAQAAFKDSKEERTAEEEEYFSRLRRWLVAQCVAICGRPPRFFDEFSLEELGDVAALAPRAGFDEWLAVRIPPPRA